MKKIILLFTILCAGALNGMETKRSFWDDFPQDIRYEIINKALETSNSLNGAIAALKNLSVVQGVGFDKLFGKLKDFTALVHILANKFDMTSQDVANEFGTPTAKQYVALGKELLNATLGGWKAQVKINKMKPLLLEGADPSFQSNGKEILYNTGDTPLYTVFRDIDTTNVARTIAKAKQLVQVLLAYGAIPDEKTLNSLDWFFTHLKSYNQGEGSVPEKEFESKTNEIRQLLEEARPKK